MYVRSSGLLCCAFMHSISLHVQLLALEEHAIRSKSECSALTSKVTKLEETNAALVARASAPSWLDTHRLNARMLTGFEQSAERRSLEDAELRTSRLETENKSLMLTLSEADKHLARLTAALTSAESRETKCVMI
jgi:hypothetical protein